MASVTYGKSIMSSVIIAKILWQMKLSRIIRLVSLDALQCTEMSSPKIDKNFI